MACRKCGSSWTTATGKDCSSCPDCCKQQRCKARKEGRMVEPTAIKQCVHCGKDFTAIGIKDITQRLLCEDEQCRKGHRQACKERREAGVFVGPRPSDEPDEARYCKRCGKGPLNRNQGTYCGRTCAGADAREHKRQFMGIPAAIREAVSFADFFYDWETQRPEWMHCEACHKKIARQSSMQRVCSEACRYRLAMPVHETCVDCQSPIAAFTRYVRRCEPCKRKRRNAWKKQAGKTPRKRCKRHGVPCDSSVTSREVFERDGYVCQLCWRRCLDKFTVVDDMPDPLSPTVDHIIAIALGIKGHTWDNVQCACWECNVAKGAAAKGQLRLVLA